MLIGYDNIAVNRLLVGVNRLFAGVNRLLIGVHRRKPISINLFPPHRHPGPQRWGPIYERVNTMYHLLCITISY